jgi:hypothetical protein
MALKPNLHYFKHSIDNKEPILDNEYIRPLNLNEKLDKYVEGAQKTKELLAKIKY